MKAAGYWSLASSYSRILRQCTLLEGGALEGVVRNQILQGGAAIVAFCISVVI